MNSEQRPTRRHHKINILMENEGDILLKFKTVTAMEYTNFFRRKVSHTKI